MFSTPGGPPRIPQLALLSTLNATGIYLLMVVGGVVRVTESGLGCPDWPLCYGRAIPPFYTESIIEMSHRYVAAIAGVLILTTVWVIWRSYRQNPKLSMPATAMLGLLSIEVPLGAVVVWTELQPIMVNIHLGIALLVLACALLIAVEARRIASAQQSPPAPPGYVWLLRLAALAMFLLLITGKVVVANNAQLACPDWPLCHGSILPGSGVNYRVGIHLLHRYMAGTVAVLSGIVIWQTFRQSNLSAGSRRWAVALGLLLALQIAAGALQVLTMLNPLWRGVHLALGTATWAALVVLFSLAQPARSMLTDRSRPSLQTAASQVSSD